MRARQNIRIAGFVLFAAAFFLPAVRDVRLASGSNAMPGWECAWATAVFSYTVPLSASHGQANPDLGLCLLALSGLTSPFVVIYLLLCWWGKKEKARLAAAAVILVGLGSAWSFFLTQSAIRFEPRQVPLIGHYLWTAGILLLLIPEVLPGQKKLVETTGD
jgi:hypothetical protein